MLIPSLMFRSWSCRHGGLWRRLSSSSTSLPSEADAVVVGGGSVGSAILYHLAARGLNAVLLERDELTSGTTWHSAGMLWRLRPSDAVRRKGLLPLISHLSSLSVSRLPSTPAQDIEMHTYTREMCKRLEDETEIASWTENGGLFIAGNAERMAEVSASCEPRLICGMILY